MNCNPKKIVVIDKDERVLDKIQKIADKRAYPIETISFDISRLDEDFYKKIENRFDVFETDPPYTEVGMKFFVGLGIISLKRNSNAYIIVPNMELEKWSDELLFKNVCNYYIKRCMKLHIPEIKTIYY
jgi:predicted methyltransferase